MSSGLRGDLHIVDEPFRAARAGAVVGTRDDGVFSRSPGVLEVSPQAPIVVVGMVRKPRGKLRGGHPAEQALLLVGQRRPVLSEVSAGEGEGRSPTGRCDLPACRSDLSLKLRVRTRADAEFPMARGLLRGALVDDVESPRYLSITSLARGEEAWQRGRVVRENGFSGAIDFASMD